MEEPKPSLRLSVTVDIGNGLQDQLSLTDRDDLKTASEVFGRKHSLSKLQIAKLHSLLQENFRASHRYLTNRTALVHSRSAASQEAPRLNSTLNRLLERQKPRPISPEAASYSFTPHINPHARRTRKAEDLLLEQGQKHQEKLEILRKSQLQQELLECSFRPSVNRRSEKLDTRKKERAPRYEELFKLAAKEKTDPSVDQTQPGAVKRPSEALLTKLSSSKLGFQARMERLKEELEKPVDPVTGQAFFHPKTNDKGPTARDTRPAHERLSVPKSRQVCSEPASKRAPAVSEASLSLVQDARKRQVQKLFRLLDSDRDGLISSSTVDVGALSDRAFLLLEPFWLYLRDSQVDMSQAEFEQRVGTLVEGLSVEEKHFLLNGVEREQVPSEPVVREPQFSSLSLALAADRYMEADAYTRQMEEWRGLQERMQLQRQEKLAKELEQCSFRPRTTKYVRH